MSTPEERVENMRRRLKEVEEEGIDLNPTLQNWVDDNLYLTDHTYAWVLHDWGIANTESLRMVLGMGIAAIVCLAAFLSYAQWKKMRRGSSERSTPAHAASSSSRADDASDEGYNPYQ
ncbi:MULTISPECIES: hypothetical protein [Halomonas]|uniref:hypothetical protein n=1 Tax=Halomonas TaxID=2745 RepID=UPI001866CF05|nr:MULTISPECIES: hypothetical protein [Halomonas]